MLVNKYLKGQKVATVPAKTSQIKREKRQERAKLPFHIPSLSPKDDREITVESRLVSIASSKTTKITSKKHSVTYED